VDRWLKKLFVQVLNSLSITYLILFIKQVINLNIYSPNSSSTSGKIPCNSTLCGQSHCSSANSNCDYKVVYLSNNTSSSGILVEDLLHLISDDDPSKAVEAKIAFG
jgi:hypothetical protein